MSRALWVSGSQPHRKNFAAKRSAEQGRQVTGPDYSAGRRVRDILPAFLDQNCEFVGVPTCCNKWWPLYQARCKYVEVAVQVILKCWWLLSMCRSAVRGLVLRTKRDTEKRQFYRLYWEHKTGYCCLSKQAILLKYAEHTYESNDTLLKYLHRWAENSTSLFRKSTEFSITSWKLLKNCNYTHSHEYKNYSLLGYGK